MSVLTRPLSWSALAFEAEENFRDARNEAEHNERAMLRSLSKTLTARREISWICGSGL